MLASRLTEDPDCSVLLLEAGRSVHSESDEADVFRGPADRVVSDTAYLWSYEASLTGREISPPNIVRGRVVGGSGSVNGSLLLRGLPEDYDSWGSSLWTFDAILPFFKALETDMDFGGPFHGDSGPIPVRRPPKESWTMLQGSFVEAAIGSGYTFKDDLNKPDGGGVGPGPMNQQDGKRVSPADAYLVLARQRPNLDLNPEHQAERIIFEGTRAVGVIGTRNTAGPFEVRGKEIILAAGGFESPHLLLNSGVGPAAHLQQLGIPLVADLPGVGKNLRCHPGVSVLVRGGDLYRFSPDEPRLQTLLTFTAPGSGSRNDMMMSVAPSAGRFTVGVSVRLPASAGSLMLRSSKPADPPRIDYGYLALDDLARLRAGLVQVESLLSEPAMLGLAGDIIEPVIGAGHFESELEDWILSRLGTAHHACGTCKLGSPGDPETVVDDRCRVVGVEGLRVIDASTIPQQVRAGPHATVLMLAERMAHLLRRGVGG